jgi:hypothetical protein
MTLFLSHTSLSPSLSLSLFLSLSHSLARSLSLFFLALALALALASLISQTGRQTDRQTDIFSLILADTALKCCVYAHTHTHTHTHTHRSFVKIALDLELALVKALCGRRHRSPSLVLGCDTVLPLHLIGILCGREGTASELWGGIVCIWSSRGGTAVAHTRTTCDSTIIHMWDDVQRCRTCSPRLGLAGQAERCYPSSLETCPCTQDVCQLASHRPGLVLPRLAA